MASNDEIINNKNNYVILFPLIKDTSDVSYFEAMANVMPHSTFVGGYTDLKKNAFEIYFEREDYVKTFFEKYGSIVVNGTLVIGRPKKSVTMDLIIKNVHPNIPNSVIRTILTESHHLPIGPRIEFCRTKLQVIVCNGRRQLPSYLNANRTVSIEIDAAQKVVIPKKITSTYTQDDEEYEIDCELMLKGKLACLSCQAFTHLASSCSLSEEASSSIRQPLDVVD